MDETVNLSDETVNLSDEMGNIQTKWNFIKKMLAIINQN